MWIGWFSVVFRHFCWCQLQCLNWKSFSAPVKIIFCCTGAAYHTMLPCMVLSHGISCNVETKIIEALLVEVTIHDTHRYSDCWWTKVSVSLLCLYTSPLQLPSMSFDSFSQDPRTYVIAHYITSMKDVSSFKLQHPGVCSTEGGAT